MRYYKVVRGEA